MSHVKRRADHNRSFTISAGEGEDLSHGLFLPAHGLREPVQVDGIDLILEFDQHTGVIGEQVPPEDLMVVTAGVQLISWRPSHTAHQLSVCAAVKVDSIRQIYIYSKN